MWLRTLRGSNRNCERRRTAVLETIDKGLEEWNALRDKRAIDWHVSLLKRLSDEKFDSKSKIDLVYQKAVQSKNLLVS